jgi:polar amino acid transport system substrate-binding protein
LNAAALPNASRYSRDNVTVTIEFEDGSIANLLYLANGDRTVGKEYFEVFCGGAIARIDDFKTLSLSRGGKTQSLKGGRDKGHRKEMDLTLEAMSQGKEAPIPFAELIEVSETTFAIEDALARGTP